MAALPEVCVVYLLDGTAPDERVLLGRKKTGIGTGKLVGVGGKLEAGESPADAAVREVFEETGLRIAAAALEPRGSLDYLFPSKPSWSQHSHVFVCRSWQGEPQESRELAPGWHPLAQLPLDEMWDDARRWLPAVLAGASVAAGYVFGEDLNTVIATAEQA